MTQIVLSFRLDVMMCPASYGNPSCAREAHVSLQMATKLILVVVNLCHIDGLACNTVARWEILRTEAAAGMTRVPILMGVVEQWSRGRK